MADLIETTEKQSLAEIKQWDFDFRKQIPTGASISDISAVHTPPTGGTADTPRVGTPENGQVAVEIGPLDATGWHYLSVRATLSNTQVIEILLRFAVEF